jgi:hypothetical protein
MARDGLRKVIRAPVRIEDEPYYIPPPTQPKCTKPLYPDLLKSGIAPFNPNLPPAVFPSLPLNSKTPTPPEQEPAPSESSSDPDLATDSDISTSSTHDFDPIGEAHWHNLDLSVQHSIWIHLTLSHADDEAAALLDLTPQQYRQIQLDACRRQQCNIDSDTLLKRLYRIQSADAEGELTNKFQPWLLLAQKYEYAYPLQLRKGARLLHQLNLPTSFLGRWKYEEKSGLMKLVSMVCKDRVVEEVHIRNPAPQAPPVILNSMPEVVPVHHTQPVSIPPIPVREVVPHNDSLGLPTLNPQLPTRLPAAEVLQAMQARMDRQRQEQQQRAQLLDNIRQVRRSNPPTGLAVSPTPQLAPAPVLNERPPRRPIVLKYGNNPNTAEAIAQFLASAANPSKTPPLDQSDTPQIPTRGPSQSISGQRLADPSPASLPPPPNSRSSGRMSLRDRSKLVPSIAGREYHKTKDFYQGDPEDTSGDEDAEEEVVPSPGLPNVNLVINDNNARASVYIGDQKVSNRTVQVQAPAFDPGFDPDGFDPDALAPFMEHENLFQPLFTYHGFPGFLHDELKAKVLVSRTLEEMFLMYGTKAWHPNSPWNLTIPSLFEPLPAGSTMSPENVDSVVGRWLIREWNRYQHLGVGQEIFRNTEVGILVLAAYAKFRDIDRRKLNTMHQLREAGQEASFVNHEPRYQNMKQMVQLNFFKTLDRIYDRAFAARGLEPPPHIIQPVTPVQQMNGNPPPSTPGASVPSFASARVDPRLKGDFAMRLIGADVDQQAITPSGKNLGIFGTEDEQSPSANRQRVSNVAAPFPEQQLTPTRNGMQVDDDAEPSTPFATPKEHAFTTPNEYSGVVTPEPASVLKSTRTEVNPAQDDTPKPASASNSAGAALNAGPGKTPETPKTPTRPAYSPLSPIAHEALQAVLQAQNKPVPNGKCHQPPMRVSNILTDFVVGVAEIDTNTKPTANGAGLQEAEAAEETVDATVEKSEPDAPKPQATQNDAPEEATDTPEEALTPPGSVPTLVDDASSTTASLPSWPADVGSEADVEDNKEPDARSPPPKRQKTNKSVSEAGSVAVQKDEGVKTPTPAAPRAPESGTRMTRSRSSTQTPAPEPPPADAVTDTAQSTVQSSRRSSLQDPRMTRSRSSTQTPVREMPPAEDQSTKKGAATATSKATPKSAMSAKSNKKTAPKTPAVAKNQQIEALKAEESGTAPGNRSAKPAVVVPTKATPKTAAKATKTGTPKTATPKTASKGTPKTAPKSRSKSAVTAAAAALKSSAKKAAGTGSTKKGKTAEPKSTVTTRAQSAAAESADGDGDVEMDG